MQTQVSNLSPLSNLQSLAAVHCSSTQVRDLSPLITVSNLQRINANKLRLTDFPQQLLQHPKLTDLWLHESSIPGIPLEVLSENPYKSCLQSLRANFADLIGGTAPVHDVKIIVIGNGRIGKTQICRRLMGQDFDESVPSTHGITVSNAALKMPDDAPDASLNLWDFGGQDLYHGTHSLFMKSRAVFVVVWTPASERAEDSIHGEMRFRNQRLPYWLQYVRKLGGAKLSRFAGAEPV